MAQNKVMNLWTAFVTAFLALCTALGLITTTAAAAVPQARTPRNSTPPASIPPATAPVLSPNSSPWSRVRSLPPTMKQRIRAEAHGKTPRCRHRSPVDVDMNTDTTATSASTAASDTTAQAQDVAPCAPSASASAPAPAPAGELLASRRH